MVVSSQPMHQESPGTGYPAGVQISPPPRVTYGGNHRWQGINVLEHPNKFNVDIRLCRTGVPHRGAAPCSTVTGEAAGVGSSSSKSVPWSASGVTPNSGQIKLPPPPPPNDCSRSGGKAPVSADIVETRIATSPHQCPSIPATTGDDNRPSLSPLGHYELREYGPSSPKAPP